MSNKWVHQRGSIRGVFTLRDGTQIPDLRICNDDEDDIIAEINDPSRPDYSFFKWNLFCDEDDDVGPIAKLDLIQAGPTLSGKVLLQLAVELTQEFNMKRLYLEDASVIELSDETEISLSWLHLFAHGKTWYQSNGFVPDVNDYTEYLKKVDMFRNQPIEPMLWTIQPYMEGSVASFISRSACSSDNLLDHMFMYTHQEWGTQFQKLLRSGARPTKAIKHHPLRPENEWVRQKAASGQYKSLTLGAHVMKVTRNGDTVRYIIFHPKQRTPILSFMYFQRNGRAEVHQIAPRNKIKCMQLIEEIVSSEPGIQSIQLVGFEYNVMRYFTHGLEWYHMIEYLPEKYTLAEFYSFMERANEIKLYELYQLQEAYPGETLGQYMTRLWQTARYQYTQTFNLLFASVDFPWTKTYDDLDEIIRTDHHLDL